MTHMPRKRGPPMALRIDTPAQNPHIALVVGDTSTSALSSATSDSDYSPFNPTLNTKPSRNMKKLSLTLPSAESSSNSLQLASEPQSATVAPEPPRLGRSRRPSIISLPSVPTATSFLHRRDEDGSPTVPYSDGPVQIIPGIWLGSEENARDWKGLIERGIKSILNVAKEVASPFDSACVSQPLRAVSSTPNFKKRIGNTNSTYYPQHLPTGRPGMHYLKLQWSHGQQDLVANGFQEGMAFTDAALERGEGVLIHCQCGISRSATMVISLVMRAAAERSACVPPEVWALQGMQGAYSFVKEKSKSVSPNMSLIYQLLEYEKKLKGHLASFARSENSVTTDDEDEEWGRRRKMLDETPSDCEENEPESTLVMQEAEALDKAMEDRIVARKSSASSISSSTSGVGMGPAWRSRYGLSRKRTGSIASNKTNGSVLSEDLVEEEEEHELLGIGGGFDDDPRSSSAEPEESSSNNSPDDDRDSVSQDSVVFTPLTARPLAMHALPSAPVWKTSFDLPQAPVTANRPTFDAPLRPKLNGLKGKRRPPPIGILPTVPSSPISIVVEPSQQSTKPNKPASLSIPSRTIPPVRVRLESGKLVPPPLHLRSSLFKPKGIPDPASTLSTPSQTLFVFPPSPTLTTRTPSAITVTSNPSGPVKFPSLSTPRVSTFRTHGRTRSFIGVGAPQTPTVAFSKVDARGYVALG